MRKKYKQKEINKEKSKDDIIEKTITFEKETNINRSKSPKNFGSIMRNLGLLNNFNKLLYEKETENKRENSVKTDVKKRRINIKNILNVNIAKKDVNTKENINNKLKIIRDSSYGKFDNEKSINKNVIIDTAKIQKNDMKDVYIKKNSKEEKVEKENNFKTNEIKMKKIIYSLNCMKKLPEKNINNDKRNEIINKKKNNNENNRENNIIHMPNVEDFDKPKNNTKEIQIKKELSFNTPKSLLKNSKYKNDDSFLKAETDKNENNERESFQFLVNQAYRNRDLSDSFSKYYESHTRSREQSMRKNEKNNQNISTEKKYNSRNKILSLMKSPENKSVTNIYENNNLKTEFNQEKKVPSRNIKTINLKANTNKRKFISSENLYVIKKVIINNNNSSFYIKNKKNNKTNININDINNNINNIDSEKKNGKHVNSNNEDKVEKENENNIDNDNNDITEDKKNICIQNYILINNLKVVNNKNSHNIHHKSKTINNDKIYSFSSIIESQSFIPNVYDIDLEILYILDEKMITIINKINNYQKCKNECDNYIQYYFNEKIYDKIVNFFTNKKNISSYIKMDILCFFLLYDISSSSFFNQTAILLKTIINIIHTNYLIIIYYIISLVKINNNKSNNSNLLKMIKLLENEPTIIQLKNKEKDEHSILKIMANNLKNINNYYKMVIDNIYGKYNNIIEDNIKFPNCNKNTELIKLKFKYKFINIISSFFFEAYKSIYNYDFNELQIFYNLYLKQNKEINNIEKSQINNKIIYYLPKIKDCYKYSLVLDLDETLISFQKNYYNNNTNNFINLLNTRLILRPGLFEFLQNMKQYYELILFSSGTCDYVDPIVRLIEKKKKFFEFVLYRQHISFDERGQYFKNLNLLNRNLRNIIIVDDIERNFKFHKENGICIKPFYGDFERDKNILNLLAQILIKIRINADESGDIRISLKKEKNSVIYSKVANNYYTNDSYS